MSRAIYCPSQPGLSSVQVLRPAQPTAKPAAKPSAELFSASSLILNGPPISIMADAGTARLKPRSI
jgi:hypothetical protein